MGDGSLHGLCERMARLRCCRAQKAQVPTHLAAVGLVTRMTSPIQGGRTCPTPPILPNSIRILVLASPWRPRKGSRSRLSNKWCPHGLRRVSVGPNGAGYYSVMERHNRSPSVATSSETRSELQKSILLSSFDMPPDWDPHASEPGW